MLNLSRQTYAFSHDSADKKRVKIDELQRLRVNTVSQFALRLFTSSKMMKFDWKLNETWRQSCNHFFVPG